MYFIKGSSAGTRSFLFSFPAEELREENLTEEVQEAPLTREMEMLKEKEEQFWKEENLMTERDLEIAAADIPERIQLTERTTSLSV